jgi:hypothetical protein
LIALLAALGGAACAPSVPAPSPAVTALPTAAAAPTSPPAPTASSATATRFTPEAVTLADGQAATIAVVREGGTAGAITLQFNMVHDPALTTIGDAADVGAVRGRGPGAGSVASGTPLACTTG